MNMNQWRHFIAASRADSTWKSAQVLINKSLFLAWRALRKIWKQCPGPDTETDWWVRHPFPLTGSVLWSDALPGWYVLEDGASSRAMTQARIEPQAWLLDGLSQGAVVLDIGAHNGRYSIPLARRVGPAGQVIAVEPFAGNVVKMQQNLALNTITNVVTIPAACWSEQALLPLVDGQQSTLFYVDTSNPGRLNVPGVPVDELTRRLQLQHVDALKIDVEGAELEVLRGARATIQRFQPVLFIELHNTLLAVAAWLREHHYKIVRILRDRSAAPGYGWLLAVPAAQADAP